MTDQEYNEYFKWCESEIEKPIIKIKYYAYRIYFSCFQFSWQGKHYKYSIPLFVECWRDSHSQAMFRMFPKLVEVEL